MKRTVGGNAASVLSLNINNLPFHFKQREQIELLSFLEQQVANVFGVTFIKRTLPWGPPSQKQLARCISWFLAIPSRSFILTARPLEPCHYRIIITLSWRSDSMYCSLFSHGYVRYSSFCAGTNSKHLCKFCFRNKTIHSADSSM